MSGQKLGKYMQDNLFGPLGMDSTAFRINDGMRSRLARIHHRGADGALTPDPSIEIPQEPEFEMGGGGLYSTAGDYLKFVRMMLNQGKSDKGEAVLKPATVAEMSKNAMGDAKVCLLKTAAPPFSNDAEFFPGMDKQWGLSFMINNDEAPTGRSAGVAGLGGPRQHLLLDRPEEGRGRRLRHPGPALRRREVAAAVLCLRKCGVRAPGLRSRPRPHVSRQPLQEPKTGADACQRIGRIVLLDEQLGRTPVQKRRADDLFAYPGRRCPPQRSSHALPGPSGVRAGSDPDRPSSIAADPVQPWRPSTHRVRA